MNEETLKKLGLSEGEAVAYSYLLENGESSVGQMIKKLPIKRGNLYNVLRGLVFKGLAEEFKKNKVVEFRVTHPSQIKYFLAKSEDELEARKKLANDLMPEMTSKYTLNYSKPAVHYFEGKEGIKKIYENTIISNPSKEVLVFRSHLDDKTMGIKFFQNYGKIRAEHEIKTRIISPTSQTDEKKKEDMALKRERKQWENLQIPAEIDIYDNKVAIISFENHIVGTIIENKATADTLREIFEKIWNTL
ncbi:hypothetical protein A3I27_01070 [Candidatus Giovannonibacteria bacterium RIFCSPLOWO2_02_FULL_43_11b]|uniref:Transcription regulator TrmB N-terminal domain-containing protein n=1 Tax=Candidatus Giovannonibacteria bacterium RIFCSPHIGHO2_12_FULL_43_15 TaxID=1798341 RepID=A0A1F5WQD6_9BACT|nr:MAG: hypothetical protein A2739_03055 [Candidatus Giovannonibacteria bacterium RIFCSPHIGHO2_01_FULL_43_100]OGF66695.1 MAG: hypothetical protein A3B97_02145 [Candidatus Giovannonibacteria bacterium RIFCSPHIGHO2_02_FULL_43_32]OGF77471.1 MAG: hypothetical protein A3F23_00640 [Candidatus Giovannonibacteria bacterium RIFCSPHIGHO2_12_FULL_43_15]OGF78842.1 MAG: hypothetical protein A3A15_00040 [Candidatus Giovannonibacteria bacterium RIFCSPLOWO2_01_FULL_43_60]OGF90416.1 MAG: hypothetical protein A3